MKNSKPLAVQGFSLIELMIVVAIMGILASLAIPQYNQYLHKAEFSELKLSVFPVKLAITECYDRNGDNSAVCNTSSASLSVTSQVTDDMLETAAAPDSIDSLTVTAAGDDPKITVIPSASSSFSSTDTYELTGITAADSRGYRYIESWQESGGGCDKNLC